MSTDFKQINVDIGMEYYLKTMSQVKEQINYAHNIPRDKVVEFYFTVILSSLQGKNNNSYTTD